MAERPATGNTDALRRRQRWLGVVVLCALAIIVLPVLLDGSGSESRYRPPPPIDRPDERPAPVTPAAPEAPAPQSAPPPAAPAPGVSSAELREPPSAWVVRTGSFADEAEAVAVRDRLRATGLPAFVLPDARDDALSTVNVGPMIEAGRAESVRQRVEDLLDTPGVVVRYP